MRTAEAAVPADARGMAVRRYAVAVALIVALGFAVRPYVFVVGFSLDDYAQLAMLAGSYPVERVTFDLFTFSDGSRAEAQRLMQAGFYPWFAHPELRLSMLRPLASALMALDWRLFGLDAIGYHVHSALWWIALVAATALLFRRVLGPGVALVALALFALDETHGVMLGWIANRNAILSAGFSVLALWAHLRWREDGWRWGRSLALGGYACALLSGEYALCFLGYFAVYEWVSAPGAARLRVGALVPLVGLAALYLAVRSVGGYGSSGSDMYIDPVLEARAFLTAAPGRLGALAADLVLAVRADWWTFGVPWGADWAARGWVSPQWALHIEPWRAWHERLGLAALVLAALIFRSAVAGATSGERRHLRWLGAGAFFALLPLLAGFPSSRSLVGPVLGWSAVLAAFLRQAWTRWRLIRGAGVATTFRMRSALAVAALFGAFHVVVPSLHTWSETVATARAATLYRDAVLAADVDDARIASQRVLLMSSAEPTSGIYMSLIRRLYGKPAARAVWTLNPTACASVVERPSASTLEVELRQGCKMLDGMLERVFRTHAAPVHLGQRFELDGMRVSVLALREGAPVRVRYQLDSPADDGSWVFLHPQPLGLQRFPIPPIGGAIEVPPPVAYDAFRGL